MFDLVIMVDWSAASAPGRVTPSPDRCWIAWADGAACSEAEYFRTRAACMARIHGLLRACKGAACVGFDFPFGYPAGCGLGGGRIAASRIAAELTSDDRDRNNRFDVAANLNKIISGSVGPFWGCPATSESTYLTAKKPPFAFDKFTEWRIIEKFLKETKKQHSISSVWKLYTTGSVGSQALTGLRELSNLARQPGIAHRVKFWPFETQWEKDLDGIVLTEIWPSLRHEAAYDHPIKDARQVLACRDWLLDKMRSGLVESALSAPAWLTSEEEQKCRLEEGWILGVR